MHPIECNKTGFATNLQVPTFRTNPLESKSSPTDAATFGCRPLLQRAAWTDFLVRTQACHLLANDGGSNRQVYVKSKKKSSAVFYKQNEINRSYKRLR